MSEYDGISETGSEIESAPQSFFKDAFDIRQTALRAGLSDEDAETQLQSFISNGRVGRQQLSNSQNNQTNTRSREDQQIALSPPNSLHPIAQLDNTLLDDQTDLNYVKQTLTGQQAPNCQVSHTHTDSSEFQQLAIDLQDYAIPTNSTYLHSNDQINATFSDKNTKRYVDAQRAFGHRLPVQQNLHYDTRFNGHQQAAIHPQNNLIRTGQLSDTLSTYNTSSTIHQTIGTRHYHRHAINFTDPRRPSSPPNIYGFEQPPPNIYEALPRSSLSGSPRNNSGSSNCQNEENIASPSYSDVNWLATTVILPSPIQNTIQQPPLPVQVPRQPVYRPSAPSVDRSTTFSTRIANLRQEQERRRATALANPPRPSLPTITTTIPLPPPPPQQPATTTTNPSNLAQLHHSSLASTYAGRRSAEARQNFPFACSACDKKYLYLNSAQKHWRMHHASVSVAPMITERWAGAPARPTPAIPRNAQAVQARGRAGRKSGVGAGAGAGGTGSVGGGNGGMASQRALPAFDSGSSNSNSDGQVGPSPPVILASAPTSQPFPPRKAIDDGNPSLTWVPAAGRWYRLVGVTGDREWWDQGLEMWRRG